LSRAIARIAVGTGAALVVLAVALQALPVRHGTIVQGWLLGCGGLLLLRLVTATRAPALGNAPSEFEAALRAGAPPTERPPELARLEREVVLGVAGQFFLHRRLRNTLRDIAGQRLRDHRGIELDAGGDDVVDAVGAEAWELLRPDRKEHLNPDAPGIPLAELERVVASLERIGT
jgi:hypothetical protein